MYIETSISLSQDSVYWFTPQDFGFPIGATVEDYSDYYVRLTYYEHSTWPTVYIKNNGCYDTSYSETTFCQPYSQWGVGEFGNLIDGNIYIWFGDISSLGLYAKTIAEEDIEYLYTQYIEYTTYTISNTPLKPNNNGTSLSFPSIIEVTGLSALTDIQVTVNNFNHNYLADIALILVAPSGDGICLMLHDFGFRDAVNATVTFSDSSPSNTYSNFTLGSIKPKTLYQVSLRDYQYERSIKMKYLVNINHIFSSFSELVANEVTNATFNGKWKLYFYDINGGDEGSILNWSLSLNDGTTSHVFAATTTSPLPTINATSYQWNGDIGWDVLTSNTAPSHTLPANSQRTCFPGLAKFFTLHVTDDASTTCELTTTVSTGHGTITANTANIGTAILTGNNSNNISITGTLVQINSALLNLQLTIGNAPPQNFTITITTNDNGCSGPGGALTTTDSFVMTTQYALPPVGINADVWVSSGGQVNISADNFQIIDTIDDAYLSNLKSITIASLPDQGTLTLCGNPVTYNQVITLQQLQENCFVYTAPELAPSKKSEKIFEFKFYVTNDINENLLVNGGQNQSITFSKLFIHVIFDSLLGSIENQQSFTTNEGVDVNINAEQWGRTTLDDIENDFSDISFTVLPSTGTLYSFNNPVITGNMYPIKGLWYKPPTQVADVTSVQFGGTAYASKSSYEYRFERVGANKIEYNFAYNQPGSVIPSPAILAVDTDLTLKEIYIKLFGVKLYYWNRFELRIVSPLGVGTVLYWKNWSVSNNNIYNLTFSDNYDHYLLGPTYTSLPAITGKPSPGALNISTVNYGSGLPLSATIMQSNPISGGKWSLYLIDHGNNAAQQHTGSLYIDHWNIEALVERPGPRTANFTISGVINPVNDAPKINSSFPIIARPEIQTSIGGLTLYDADIDPPGYITITINVTDGTLWLIYSAGTDVTGNHTNQLTIYGPYANVKAVIELNDNLKYLSNAGFIGQDRAIFVTSTDISTRTTKVDIYVKPEPGLSGNLTVQKRIDHSKLLDTAIKLYYNDPRIDGRYYDKGQLLSGPIKSVPDFEGQLIAFLEYTTEWKAYLLCGHDNGLGLEWKQVVSSSATSKESLIDTRTGLPYDPYWQSNCSPPWICM